MTPAQATALDAIAAAAVSCERQTGCPAPLTAAQAGLESAWLAKMPPDSNNCFGIKNTDRYPGCVYALTTEWLHGQPEKQRLAFEKYPTLADCFADHAHLLTIGCYAPAWRQYQTDHDLDRFTAAIAAHYATDPNYLIAVQQLEHGPHLTAAIAAARAKENA